jgi:hypothetical protein
MKRQSNARALHRRTNLQATSLLTYLLGSAILFSQFVLPISAAPAKNNPGGTTWTLKEIRVFNTMDRSVATITSERYDATGGIVDVQISGDILGGICSGGYEKIRFTWRFAQDVTQVVHGGTVSASLHAGQASKSENCATGIAYRSFLGIFASSGDRSPFPEQENRLIDGERFQTGNGFRVRAASDPQSGIGTTKVNTHEASSRYSLAYFSISMNTPTASGGGILQYAYVYENRSGGGENSSGGGGNLTAEDNTDRAGADYKDFDLPQPRYELCRNACANDPNCRAYTFVRPGVQGSSARCWLKSSAPPGSSSNCCVSGVKR